MSLRKKLREALSLNLGQTLGPDAAASIEAACFPAQDSSQKSLLSKWRHLIEPVVLKSPTPLPWDEVLQSYVKVFEGLDSVVVVRPGAVDRPLLIWIAAGKLSEVLSLVDQAKRWAFEQGYKAVSYLGRPGWIRAAGFKKTSIYGVMEL